MNEFLQAAMSFPAAIFTALLGFVVLFWSLVLMGGSDPHALDFHADGHMDLGDIGHGHVDAGGVGHGHDVDVSHGHEGGLGWFTWILSLMNVGMVPVSIVGSSLVMLAWVVAMVLQIYASPTMAAAVGVTGSGVLILLCAMFASAILTALATRPMRGVFETATFEGGENLIDQVCTISTTHVDATFGQASFKTGGAPLILSVRCPQENKLAKGSQAVIVGYDAAKSIYIVGELEPRESRQNDVQMADSSDAARDANGDDRTRATRVRDGRARSG
jgi:hypothetical protein